MEPVRALKTLPRLYEFEELKCAIRKLPYVTLAPVRAVGDKGPGWQVSLSCSRCQEYGSCRKQQEPAVRLSRVHPTELACLQELLRRLQDRHVDCAEAVAKKAAADAASAATEHVNWSSCMPTTHAPKALASVMLCASTLALECGSIGRLLF
jgi:hypothetical protein